MATLEQVIGRLNGPLAPLIDRCVGYRYEGLPAGIHRGLPAPKLTVVISLGDPLRLRPDEARDVESHQMLVGGMHIKPATIFHDGSQYGVQFDLTPRGANCLFGLPAAELTGQVVPLTEILPEAHELGERMASAVSWSARFEVLDELLRRRSVKRDVTNVDLAWNQIVAAGGQTRIGDISGAVGWSKRHLRDRFRAEYGLTPKDVARMARFARASRLLAEPEASFADVAATCGYVDQSHMTREWHDFAGCSPSVWMATEDLPFVQDDGVLAAAS